MIVRTSVEPYAQSAAARTAELYGTSIKPHLVRAQEAADPYLQVSFETYALACTAMGSTSFISRRTRHAVAGCKEVL